MRLWADEVDEWIDGVVAGVNASTVQRFDEQMHLRRYLTIYAALWQNSVVREMGFKANFVLWIVVEMLWFALQLWFFMVIYSHTDHVGTWTKCQGVRLLGASHVIM